MRPIFKDYPEYIFDGEIYCHKLKHNFNKIISLARKTKPTQEDFDEAAKYLQYWIFDMPSANGGYEERYQTLKVLIKEGGIVTLCPHKLIHSYEELAEAQSEWLAEGYEGVMINLADGKYENKRSKNILKFKLFQDEEFEILWVEEGIGNRSGMFGRALLKTKDGQQFDANARGDREFYRQLLNDRNILKGKMATVRYQNLTPDGIPRFPVIVAIRNYE